MTYEEVITALGEESNTRRRRTRTVQVFLATMVGLQAAAFGYLVATGSESFSSAMISILPAACFIGVACGMTSQAKSLLANAIQSGDERIIGHLADALTSGEQSVIDMSRDALIQLLPKVEPGAAPLDKIQHVALIQRLPLENDAYVAAVIKGLGVIGRPESIPVLESIARDKKSGYVKGSSSRFSSLALNSLASLRMALAKETIQKKIAEVDALRSQLQIHNPMVVEEAEANQRA